MAGIGRVSAGDVLAGFWRTWIRGEHHLWLESEDPLEMAGGFTVSQDDGFPELEPFGLGWPGLAPTCDGGREDPGVSPVCGLGRRVRDGSAAGGACC